MTNNKDGYNSTSLEVVNIFKYLGAIISPEGSRKEILVSIPWLN